jgi:hypothetical protein
MRGMSLPGAPRRRRFTPVAAVAAVAAASAAWLVTDHLERDNDFCTACHLEPGVPLHRGIRRDFDRSPPASLAGLHARKARSEGEGGGFRCIDCHGGASLRGRMRVKALAAKDAFWYAVGCFEEPQAMRWPLWDEDCGQCHPSFDESQSKSWQSPRFHELPLHNVELGVGCVECHRSHDRGGDANAYFLRAPWVRTRCARCHSEFEEEVE